MTKDEKNLAKDILKKKEISRYEAKFLMNLFFHGSILELGEAINVNAFWIKEQLNSVKVFSTDTQTRILQECKRLMNLKSKKIKAN